MNWVYKTVFANEVAVVDVITGREFVGETTGGHGPPAEILFDEGAEIWKIVHVREGREAICGNMLVNFGLKFVILVGVEGYGEH